MTSLSDALLKYFILALTFFGLAIYLAVVLMRLARALLDFFKFTSDCHDPVPQG